MSLPVTAGSSHPSLSPLTSWMRRKKSRRSTSFKFTEIGPCRCSGQKKGGTPDALLSGPEVSHHSGHARGGILHHGGVGIGAARTELDAMETGELLSGVSVLVWYTGCMTTMSLALA